MPNGFSFSISRRDSKARTGIFLTPNGVIATPAFMPVATFGAIRGVGAEDMEALGAQILLTNTYHLHERPGEADVAALGGLHGFTTWRGPWLTDSGGFQVTSLSDHAKVSEEGVAFRSTLDGSARLLTPEKAIAIQEALGSDIAMVLDECLPPAQDAGNAALCQQGETKMRHAMDRTLRWAERSQRARRRSDQAVFGIVQGGADPGLRATSARLTAALGFDGYAHGGLGLGEPRELRGELISITHESLPVETPRYLMGLGRPEDIVLAIECGVDLFDCVVPTRNGRHGVLFTSAGVLHLKNARFRQDARPPDENCDCPACTRYSRAYLRHLLQLGEMLGARLASLHNLRFYLRLMENAREAIAQNRFREFKQKILDASQARI